MWVFGCVLGCVFFRVFFVVFSGVHGAHGFTGGLGLWVQSACKGLQGLPEGFRKAAPERMITVVTKSTPN